MQKVVSLNISKSFINCTSKGLTDVTKPSIRNEHVEVTTSYIVGLVVNIIVTEYMNLLRRNKGGNRIAKRFLV